MFILFLVLIAAAWATIGIFLAKWLKQSGYARPFKGRDWDERQLYGAGLPKATDYNHGFYGWLHHSITLGSRSLLPAYTLSVFALVFLARVRE
ncbi:hypothetical protein EJ02DRAFT_428115 [Clathrospora elynae]|uniref:Uncharacterized protein n=1 Tax=Clathrospora elynae TaxID=706981 RepID=A0A6A5S6N9_9PLEO|nr:hypothetical protein EJ02DRAFT_428115 [Clathrospora elynae]